jgi:hypothetical protein
MSGKEELAKMWHNMDVEKKYLESNKNAALPKEIIEHIIKNGKYYTVSERYPNKIMKCDICDKQIKGGLGNEPNFEIGINQKYDLCMECVNTRIN